MDRDKNDKSQGQGSPGHQPGYGSESNRKGTPQADGDPEASDPGTPMVGEGGHLSSARRKGAGHLRSEEQARPGGRRLASGRRVTAQPVRPVPGRRAGAARSFRPLRAVRNAKKRWSMKRKPVRKDSKDAQLSSSREAPDGALLTTNQGLPLNDDQNHSGRASAGRPCWKISPPRKDHPLRSRAHSGADRSRARLGGARLLPGVQDLARPDARQRFSRTRRANAGLRSLLDGRGLTRLGRPGSRRPGFAVKFYTQEGNFDLVGNNIPVFFIQDAIKFPDLIHAVKPEPHNEMPQAASAHDTFWDFISLMPESMHMIMWAMSDRAIPRSLRMMEGFGVHTFRSSTRRASHASSSFTGSLCSASIRWPGTRRRRSRERTPTFTVGTSGRRSKAELPGVGARDPGRRGRGRA